MMAYKVLLHPQQTCQSQKITDIQSRPISTDCSKNNNPSTFKSHWAAAVTTKPKHHANLHVKVAAQTQIAPSDRATMTLWPSAPMADVAAVSSNPAATSSLFQAVSVHDSRSARKWYVCFEECWTMSLLCVKAYYMCGLFLWIPKLSVTTDSWYCRTESYPTLSCVVFSASCPILIVWLVFLFKGFSLIPTSIQW